MSSRNDPCWCGSNKKWKKCHYPEVSPSQRSSPLTTSQATEYLKKYQIILKTPEQIEGIRAACKIATTILSALCKEAKVGMTPNDLDRLSQKLHLQYGAIPAALGYGYPPFPKTICTSLNDEICHGIPDDIPFKEGDIVNIDVASIVDGYFGDCSRMVKIGRVDEEKQRVVATAYDCLHEAIKICREGVLIKEIGETIERIAKANHCSVVDQFVGHGVGLYFHEAPQIPHHYNGLEIPLVEGMTFTIEPMINAGRKEAVIDPKNQWEARTIDGKPSAQFEHTLLIHKTYAEILTPYPSDG